LSRPSRRRKCMRFSVYAGRKHWLSHICNDTSFRTSFLVLRSTCACFVAVPMKTARKTTSKHSANHPHAWKYIRFPCCKASHRLRLRWATFTPVRAHRVYILCTDAHAPRTNHDETLLLQTHDTAYCYNPVLDHISDNICTQERLISRSSIIQYIFFRTSSSFQLQKYQRK
jgi:hypothetical protein